MRRSREIVNVLMPAVLELAQRAARQAEEFAGIVKIAALI